MTRSRTRRRGNVALAEQQAPADDRQVLREQLRQALDNEQLLQESFAELAAQLQDPGWIRLSAQFEQEFTAENLKQIRAICRLFAVKNPLIRRSLSLRSAYVWGKGVEITARANGKKKREQDVQAVIDAFLADVGNQRAFTSGAARERLERCLGTDGEFFTALFTLPTTGEVQVRVVGADEITEIICNPQDRSEPWFYRRVWIQRTLRDDGHTVDEQREQFHPAVDYRPRDRRKTFGRIPVAWDAPMLHVKVNDLEGQQRGIPDAYAAIDWAMAYKVFLEDWARLVKSLSRFAWRMTAKGSTRAQARTKLAERPPRDASGRPNDVGAVAMTPPDQTFEAIPKSGATVDSESGKPLAAMVASALDVPVTMLLADPGQTGARAVAETLDTPMELAMGQRRDLWAGVYRRILQYAVAESVRAPDGKLKGTVTVDAYGRQTVKLGSATDPTIDIDWPDLQASMTAVVQAVVQAASTGTIPPEQIARLLLTAIGVRHVDTIIEAMVDDDGNFVWPEGPPAATPNNPRDLRNPTSMQPDDDPDGGAGEDEAAGEALIAV
ncbi:hypothetical protein Ade02nite_19590 [Paractinoplanes deccanensis]|uniref:Portal protein n=1 Tax=Paractinoplanes deccanensis TaxID=113561 RepID=A0ABQ3XZZ8_9ACTN|nr:hypothetical protein [Actinoplanes deccanensis]GID73318.1 hypothetical protein Ade02nite_19590 [Actinoplanes deccanensis]